MITREIVHAFTEGQCHALAIVLSNEMGWPMYAVRFEDEDPAVSDPGHVVVKSPLGFLDIMGVVDENTLADYFRCPVNTIYPVTRRDISNFPSYCKPNLNAARHVAALLLEQYFPKKESMSTPELQRVADEMRKATVKLQIKGLKVDTRIEDDTVKTVFTFDGRKTYFSNSMRLHDRRVEVQDRHPEVKFDWDVEFATQH